MSFTKSRRVYWILILFFAFSPLQSMLGDEIRKDYCVMSGEAMRRAEREIYEKFGMRADSASGGAITVIRHEGLGVETNVPFTIQEGRRLLIACTDILLKHLNAHRPLRPFLFEYPFPAERFSFSIGINPEVEKTMPKDALLMCSHSEGTIRYYKPPEGKDPFARMILVLKETYQEALQKLAKEEKNYQLPKNHLSPEEVTSGLADIDEAISEVRKFVQSGEAESDLPRYFGPRDYVDMAWFLDAYALELAKKYDMEFHLAGSFSDETNDIYPLMFMSFQQMTLQQGKEFAIPLIKNFLCELRRSPVVKKYNEYRNESYKDYRYPPLLTEEPVPEQMALKISFWDKNFDRAKKPYLAEIVFLCGNFYYYQANPETQARELILKESFGDAMRGNDKK